MEASLTGLTVWEAKERAGLLARETEEWREKRLLAEDPNTTGAELEQCARAVCQELDIWQPGEPMGNYKNVRVNALLLAEAIVAHPNTPPHILKRLLGRVFNRELGERTLITKAMCRNPALPFLTLEAPDFWMNLYGDVCSALLREEALPSSIVRLLLRHPGRYIEDIEEASGTPRTDHSVADAARLHISQAPPLQAARDGCKAVTEFWKDYCIRQQHDPDWLFGDYHAEDWHREMVEIGLAPAWMTAFYGDSDPVAPAPSSTMEEHTLKWYAGQPEYAPLLQSDASPHDLMQITKKWVKREDNDIPLLLLAHPHVTVEILRHIMEQKPYKELRLHLAAHPLTPPDVLVQLMDIPIKRELIDLPPGEDKWQDVNARYDALREENALTRRLACHHPNAPPGLMGRARRAFAAATEPLYGVTGLPDTGLPLIDFATALRGVCASEIKAQNIEPSDWVYFLIAALSVPVSAAPLDHLGRSPLDLLHHLARDGNRLVRWAAKTRFADPNFTFTWHEESND